MSLDLTGTAPSITAPAGVDGRGEVAVFNDSTSANFVGYLFDDSGFDGAAVRTSMDDNVESSGATFGTFFDGPRSWTLEVILALGTTTAISIARRDKLYRAMNAKTADGTFAWTEAGSARQIGFRREQPPRGPDKDRHVLLAGISADPRIYGASATAGPGTFAVAGNVGTLPVFTLTSPTNTITLSRTSPSPTETLSLTGLSGAGNVTVDFLNKTVTASSGTADRYNAVSFPSSVWWELIGGVNNTVSVSGATVSGTGIAYRPAWS